MLLRNLQFLALMFAASASALLLCAADGRAASSLLARHLSEIPPRLVVPGAERFGDPEGTPPGAPAYDGDGELLGHVFVTSDLVNTVGYSGKPIDIAVGLDLDGVITGARLVDHHEPIILIGIPEERITGFVSAYAGTNVARQAEAAGDPSAGGGEAAFERRPVDGVSGATVTVMVIDDSIIRAAVKFARSRGLGGLRARAGTDDGPDYALALDEAEIVDWATLVGDGSVRRLSLSVEDVSDAFLAIASRVEDEAEHEEERHAGEEGERRGAERYREAAQRAESDDPEATFIDLYTGLVTIPTIGESLLGQREYDLLQQRLEPGQQAIFIGGKGLYSFKGSGYVRGGIFDRIQLVQGDTTFRFRDRNHKRLADVAAAGAPDLDEVGLFRIPRSEALDPAQPWRLELLVQRAVGAREKVFTTFDLSYRPPQKYLARVELVAAAPPPAAEPTATQPPPDDAQAEMAARDELWKRIWQARAVDIAILVALLVGLTLLFFFQDWLVRRPRLTSWVRYGFLAMTLVWLGFYARAQLSVVNVLTFSNSLLTDFSWTYFLMDPLIFILWFSVAAGLLFWGRGAFCGWLCPFGALQEITNHIGRRLGIRQIEVPWGLNERLWPIKYMIFLGLFGFALYSLSTAEALAEVEPFKTAIVLHFVRSWPFVAYAVGLLVVGLFVERFFCRYLCPLGAALAIPARLRMFDWLKRHKECGSPCQRCANECPVQAIHPDGRINVNECIYCLDCQKLYYDDQKCPHMIQQRLKKERRIARSSKGMLGQEEPAARAQNHEEHATPSG